jgi:hypothetical protein
MARGDFAGADRMAGQLEAPQPVIHLVFLPAALALRVRAAVGLGQEQRAERLRFRAAALRR